MTTQEANRRLASDLKALVHDAEELMKATAGQAGEKVTELRARLAAALESAKATGHRLEEDGRRSQGHGSHHSRASLRIHRHRVWGGAVGGRAGGAQIVTYGRSG